ncbi:hypothetical protein SAY87_020787 [Trapa incisa]|uniref:BRCT domain-containing protein n=1 Tax=Trapa incisa TaxID=236973 RepID=A0AAN7JR65_9MYRT|nr:hypothetical protein SAY87_020787 [Trapa incisa]
MDGFKALASRFEMNEKNYGKATTTYSVNISVFKSARLVHLRPQWALNILKKPIVTLSWLYHCQDEHQIVLQDSYRRYPLLLFWLKKEQLQLKREKKEARSLAALGIIDVVRVRPNWLEDCDQEKKEIAVLQKPVAYDLLLPKGLSSTPYKSLFNFLKDRSKNRMPMLLMDESPFSMLVRYLKE